MYRALHIHLPRALLLSLLALPAACEEGEGRALARPDQLAIAIIRGEGMHLPVRDPATPEDDPGRAPQAVIARVTVALDAEEEQELGATGPGLRMPGVEIHWRVLEPFCRVEAAVTPLEGDSAVNHFLRPTRAGVCHLVAEGVVDGRPFASDTAVARFDPGPGVSFVLDPYEVVPVGGSLPVPPLLLDVKDAYGNPVFSAPAYTAVLTSGAPALRMVDTLITAGAEVLGNLRMTVGPTTADLPVWAMRAMGTHYWRVSWACYDLDLAGGAHVDSAHFWMDSARASPGGGRSARGVGVGLRGGLSQRTWVRGEPVRQSTVGATRFAAQRPGSLMWSNGQVSAAREPMAQRYDGGNLCDPPAEGGAWARFAPAQVVRGDSIPPELP